MLDHSLQLQVQQVISNHTGKQISIDSFKTVSGGDINEAYRVTTNEGLFFVKLNDANSYPEMFEQEALGLTELAKTNIIQTPEVIATGKTEFDAFLLLEWIEQGSPSSTFWEDFGIQLAKLHQTTNDRFGWMNNNYIGSLVQYNSWTEDWSEFFILNRLEPQLKFAMERGLMNRFHSVKFEKLFHKLDDLFPKEQPALLHGDLWSGNFMLSSEGNPVVIDPAVYYGHREMDLAMTKLFGGFNSQLYQSYNEEFPLETDWDERVLLCNLYPLLVHVNLFGVGYLHQVENALRRFV